MYNPKFNFPSLTRETIDGSRKYATPDGEKLPSVTTILDTTKSTEAKQALHEWRARVGHKKAQEITTEASGRGTRMHKYLEDYVTTGILNSPGTNPYSIQSHSMAKTIIDKGLVNCSEFYGTEVSLYYPKIYAGTTDLIATHNGKLCICDFKQSNKQKKTEWISDYFLQLAAYGAAFNEVYSEKVVGGSIFMCTPNLEYQEWSITGKEYQEWIDKWFMRVEQYYSQYV